MRFNNVQTLVGLYLNGAPNYIVKGQKVNVYYLTPTAKGSILLKHNKLAKATVAYSSCSNQ